MSEEYFSHPVVKMRPSIFTYMIIFSLYLAFVLVVVGVFYDVIESKDKELVSLKFTNADLRAQVRGLKLNLDSGVQSLRVMESELRACVHEKNEAADECSMAIFNETIKTELEHYNYESCMASVPFVDVARAFGESHEYVLNEFDCTEFSAGCIQLFQSMGYSAYRKIVKTEFGRHAIAVVELPVECTPPYVHIITPDEFPTYFGP